MSNEEVQDVIDECLAEFHEDKELDEEVDTLEEEDPEEDPR